MIINLRINTDYHTVRPETSDCSVDELIGYILNDMSEDLGHLYGKLIASMECFEDMKRFLIDGFVGKFMNSVDSELSKCGDSSNGKD